MIETKHDTYKKPRAETCHCSEPKPDGTCCNLICFERPNYFCGHLLTDTDLSKEQQYVVEKHKLYNRTLHGWGVVCGLRLTCDEECCGAVVIDEGYAIDDCGNDLVVCEPLRFDVVSLLKEKGWIVGDQVYDPCAPKEEKEECEYTQCFYVTVCYDEESRDFTTPFVAGCRPALTECEPTRIRESVRFDVLDKLPDENEWLKDLLERFKKCFSIFTAGPFARALNDDTKKALLERICSNPDNIEGNEYDRINELFCELRGLLILYLQKRPDKYNCKLIDEVRGNVAPDPRDTRGNYVREVKAAISELLRLAFQHAISCALGELVPPCPGPQHAGCVVLGTVEVKNGCVTHVCNCPRKYVWSFANFFQVLIATLFEEIACEEKQRAPADPQLGYADRINLAEDANAGYRRHIDDARKEKKDRYVCCAQIPASCEDILRLINVTPRFLHYAGTETISAFAKVVAAFRNIFNFTDSRMFSPSMLRNLHQEKFEEAIRYLGIRNVQYVDVTVPSRPVHPIEELVRSGLGKIGESTLFAERTPDNVIVNAYAVPRAVESEASLELNRRVVQAEADAKAANNLAMSFEKRLVEMQEQIGNLTRGGGPTVAEVRRRIREELSRTTEGPETEARTARKRPAKRRPTKAPEGEGGENA